MNEELINQIVQRILSDASFQALLKGERNGAGAAVVKPEALVLLNYVSDFKRILNAVQARWGAEYTLTVLPSERVAKAHPVLPEGLNWSTPQDAMTKTDWAKIIIPACSANTLAKAALGLRDTPLSELIGRGIQRGTPIALITESLGFTDQTPKAYKELYEGYLQKVQAYGVQVYARIGDLETAAFTSAKAAATASLDTTTVKPKITAAEPEANPEPHLGLIPSFEPGSAPSKGTPSALSRNEICFEKKFLGDKEAYAFPEASRVLVNRFTVISPLARDTLRLRRVELCIVEEGRR